MLKKKRKQKKRNQSKQSKIMRAITPFKATKDTDLDLAVGDEVVILSKVEYINKFNLKSMLSSTHKMALFKLYKFLYSITNTNLKIISSLIMTAR